MEKEPARRLEHRLVKVLIFSPQQGKPLLRSTIYGKKKGPRPDDLII
jgi:hypothetical protein